MTEQPILLPSGAVVTLAPPGPPQIAVVPPGPTPVLIMPVPGVPGVEGPSGSNAPVENEIPGGTQNGVNEVFTLVNSYLAGSTQVFRNGLRERLNVGYNESGAAQITFTTAPLVTDVLTVDYLI
jgi:hypothetical protein